MVMKKEKAVIDYSFEEDILFVRPENRDYSSSVQIGNFILDLKGKNQIVGIEILDASKIFNVVKEWLINIQGGEIQINVSNNVIHLRIVLMYKLRNALVPGVVDIERISPEILQNSSMNLAIASA